MDPSYEHVRELPNFWQFYWNYLCWLLIDIEGQPKLLIEITLLQLLEWIFCISRFYCNLTHESCHLNQASFQKPSPESLQVTLTGALRTKVDHDGANIMVVLYESGLVTDCQAGANKDRILANDYVVRRLEKLTAVKDVSGKKTVTGSVNFALWEGFNAAKCGVAVFVENSSHQIFGSQNFQLPDKLWGLELIDLNYCVIIWLLIVMGCMLYCDWIP